MTEDLLRAYFTCSGCSSLKLSADSAGRTTSLFPVNAAPPVPAPPPANAPIAAPLPPPARPPIRAPKPAPPPAKTAVRLPFPVSVRLTADVEMAISDPLRLIEVSRTSSEAAPLKRPRGLASTTVPATLAPAGIAVRPSIVIGLATVAVKVWPAVLIFDPSASASRTVSTVPAGTINGLGGSGLGSAFMAVLDIAEFDIADPEALFDIAEPLPAPLLSLEPELAEFPLGADV